MRYRFSAGTSWVTPTAVTPRGTMETRCTGSACGRRVPDLVVGDALALAEHAGAALEPHRDPIDRLLQLLHADELPAAPRGVQCGFVDDAREFGPGGAGRAGRERVEIDLGAQRVATGLNAQNRRPPASVGEVGDNLAVEAPRAEQRRAEHLRVGRAGVSGE